MILRVKLFISKVFFCNQLIPICGRMTVVNHVPGKVRRIRVLKKCCSTASSLDANCRKCRVSRIRFGISCELDWPRSEKAGERTERYRQCGKKQSLWSGVWFPGSSSRLILVQFYRNMKRLVNPQTCLECMFDSVLGIKGDPTPIIKIAKKFYFSPCA